MWTFLMGIGGKVAAVGMAVMAAIGMAFAIKQSGVKSEQAAESKREVHNDEAANQARAEVDRAGAGTVAAELQRDWQQR